VVPALVPPVDAVMTPVTTPVVNQGQRTTDNGQRTTDNGQRKDPVGIDDNNAAALVTERGQLSMDNGQQEKRFTMLMVDDSPDMCRFVHDYFRGEYTVLTANNGEVALQRLEENDNIDLVVSDVTMPKMDGLELCKRIKTDLRWSHIPVILLTGRRGDQLEMEGLRLGADDYITKPFNVEMLRLRVKKFIEKRENRQRQFREKMDVAPSEITITSVDEQFIQRAIKICEDHMSDTEFSVEVLGHELSLSRTYLYKKLINITGKGPAEFIRTIRLKRGKQYLEQSMMPIADIAAELGYANPKRFTENFKAEFGMSPSEYSKKFREEKAKTTQE
jgi:YesN/AraC family two-component response regulator